MDLTHLLGLLGIESEVEGTLTLSEIISTLKRGHTEPLLEKGAWRNV